MFESEEDKIVKRIKDYIKMKNPLGGTYIMLRNGHILDIDDYNRTVIFDNKINPQDTYVYIKIDWYLSKLKLRYPFLVYFNTLLVAYLLKLGFARIGNFILSATGLKYVAVTTGYEKYLSIELVNLDTAVDNTNLRKIVFEMLDGKLISGDKELTDKEYHKIRSMFLSQRLFAGYTPDEAERIIEDYYDRDNKPSIKEVARITMDYDRIFQPYKVCYDMNSLEEIDCWSIKLD